MVNDKILGKIPRISMRIPRQFYEYPLVVYLIPHPGLLNTPGEFHIMTIVLILADFVYQLLHFLELTFIVPKYLANRQGDSR